MNNAVRYDYFGFLCFNMSLKVVNEQFLVEDTFPGERCWDKNDLSDVGLFNFKYVIDRK